MIERIPDQIPVQTGEWRGTTFDIIPKETFAMACRKINELVDAVNVLQESQNTYWTDIAELKKELQTPAENVQPDAESRPENVQDKFAEQRKWIGCLCWFWNFKRVNAIIGVLTDFDIDEPHFKKNGLEWFEHCEPVKPNDDIIYKGGDNE